MPVLVDFRLIAEFGSEARVLVLAVLANAYRPLTGYRVAKTGEVPRPKAYEQLERLAKAGVAPTRRRDGSCSTRTSRPSSESGCGSSWDVDWFSERERRQPETDAFLARLDKTPPPAKPKGWKPRSGTLRQLNRERETGRSRMPS